MRTNYKLTKFTIMIGRVQDEYRHNRLSVIPGGSSVVLHYANGNVFTYDKIKNMNAYLRIALNKPDVLFAMIGGTKITKDDI